MAVAYVGYAGADLVAEGTCISMQCVKPIFLRERKQFVPCGKCYNCLANNRAQWTYRLNCENLASRFSLFVTFTYSNENLPFRIQCVDVETGEEQIKFVRQSEMDSNYNLVSGVVCLNKPVPSVYKRDLQLYFKRLRKVLGDKSFRYFSTSEYGDRTNRPHYHVLFFFQKYFDRKDLYDKIEKAWSLGNVNFGETETASIAYCTKYCLKDSPIPLMAEKPFRLMSKRPLIGELGLQNYIQNLDYTGYYRTFMRGIASASTPRIYKDKMLQQVEEPVQMSIKQQIQAYAEHREYARYQHWCKTHKGSFEDYRQFCFHQAEYHEEIACKRRTKTTL